MNPRNRVIRTKVNPNFEHDITNQFKQLEQRANLIISEVIKAYNGNDPSELAELIDVPLVEQGLDFWTVEELQSIAKTVLSE